MTSSNGGQRWGLAEPAKTRMSSHDPTSPLHVHAHIDEFSALQHVPLIGEAPRGSLHRRSGRFVWRNQPEVLADRCQTEEGGGSWARPKSGAVADDVGWRRRRTDRGITWVIFDHRCPLGTHNVPVGAVARRSALVPQPAQIGGSACVLPDRARHSASRCGSTTPVCTGQLLDKPVGSGAELIWGWDGI